MALPTGNQVFVFFSRVVSPTNKCYKIVAPNVGVALQGVHIILGGCVTNFSEIAKKRLQNDPESTVMGKMAWILLGIVYTSTIWGVACT